MRRSLRKACRLGGDVPATEPRALRLEIEDFKLALGPPSQWGPTQLTEAHWHWQWHDNTSLRAHLGEPLVSSRPQESELQALHRT
jgi:hypothetical protein